MNKEDIKKAYLEGDIVEFAAQHNLSLSSIYKTAQIEKWAKERDTSALAKRESFELNLHPTPPPQQLETLPIKEQGSFYQKRMAQFALRTLPIFETLEEESLLKSMDALDKFDKIARRTFALDEQTSATPIINVNILSEGLQKYAKVQENSASTIEADVTHLHSALPETS